MSESKRVEDGPFHLGPEVVVRSTQGSERVSTTLVRTSGGRAFRIDSHEARMLAAMDGRTRHQLVELFPDAPDRPQVEEVLDRALDVGLVVNEHSSPSTGAPTRSRHNPLAVRLPLSRRRAPLQHAPRWAGSFFTSPVVTVGVLNAIGGILALSYTVRTSVATLGVLSPLAWLIVVAALVVTLALHELAHGLSLVHYGGRVPEVGLALVSFVPIFYCDTTDVWALQERRHRLVVLGAGLYLQVQLASLAGWLAFITDHTGVAHAVLQSYAFINLALVLVNLNPLLKLDGYWLLATVLDMPNLQESAIRSVALLRKRPHPISWPLLAFGLACAAYAAFAAARLALFALGVVLPIWRPVLVIAVLAVAVAMVLRRRRQGRRPL